VKIVSDTWQWCYDSQIDKAQGHLSLLLAVAHAVPPHFNSVPSKGVFAHSIGCRLCSTVGLLPREISGSSPLISQYDTTRNANYLTCAQNYTSSSCSQNYKCTRRSAVTAQRAACETWTAHPSYWGRCLKAQTLWERGHPLLKCWYCSIGVDGATAILEKLGVTHDLGW